MDIESIKGLPLEDQIKELKKLKERFAKEKEALKGQIFDLEDSRKQKEAFAKNLVASQREHTTAEVSVIVSSIKDVKGVLTDKNKELQFVEKAIKAAEDLLKKREQELEEEEEEAMHEFELLLEQLIIIYKKEQEKRPDFLEEVLGSNGKKQEKTEKKTKKEKQLEDELAGVQTRQRRGREDQDYLARQQQRQGDYLPTPGKTGDDEGNAYIPQSHGEKLYEHDDSGTLYENKSEDYLPRQRSMENAKEHESEKDKLLKKIKQYESGR
ncbi:hypothetical protein KY325_01340 [Candidatus Woesearchaeota archaeon]|nr:hypothetical protein [Candidatus Woesearchaeota archaeon]MBW3017784.1 hypothetical protein [Candidatus Woesearchaeota archaeon]